MDLMTMAVEASRDYAHEMGALIDQTTLATATSATVAQELVAFLRTSDPQLLAGWLDTQAVSFLRQAILRRDASIRTHNRVQACRSVFRDAAKEFEQSGDDTDLRTHFLSETYVIPGGVRMLLKDMTAEHLSYVADEYATRAKSNLMREAFLRALAKKCGQRPVGDVLDEEAVAKVWCDLSGN